jgi:translocation and assembly module TamB
MSRARKAVLAAGIVVLLVIFLAVLAFGLLQTGASKRRLASYISGMLTESLAWDINIEGLSGNVPFNMHVDRITIEDAEGPWLEIRDLTIDAVPFGLLGRRVELDEISADYIEVVRAPVPKKKPVDDPWTAPQLPALPEWLMIHDIRVDELVLSAALLAGEAATFEAEGALVPGTTEGSPIRLKLTRTDADTTRFDLKANLANNELTLELDAVDAEILPRLTRTEGPALITLNGSGPLSDWKAELDASWGETPLASARMNLHVQERVTADGEVDLNLSHPLFPPVAAERFGARGQLAFDIAMTGENTIELKTVRIETPEAAIELTGTTSIEAKTLDLTAALTYAKAELLLPLREHDGNVPLTADVTATGAFSSPDLRVRASLAGSEVLTTALTLNFGETLAWEVKVDLTPAPLLVPEESMRLLGDSVTAAARGEYSENIVSVDEVRIEAAAAEVSGDATLNWPDHVLAADLTADVADLAVFAAFTDQPVGGAAKLSMQVSGDIAQTKFSLTLSGTQLTLADAAAESLDLQLSGSTGGWPDHLQENIQAVAKGDATGVVIDGRAVPAFTLAADVAAPTLDVIQVRGLQIENDTLQLAAKGAVWPKEPRADLDLTLDVSSLETYAGMFDQPYTGQLHVVARTQTQGAAQSAFEVTARWEQPGGLPEPANAVVGNVIALETEGTLEEKTLRIARLAMDAGHLQASAQGSYGLESRQIDITAEVNAAELEVAGEAAGVPLSGTLTLTATATGTPDALAIQADATGSNLQYENYQVDKLDLALDAQGLPKQPDGTLTFTLQEAGETIQGDAQIAYEEQVVTVPALEVRTGSNRVTGNLRYNLETKAASGSLDAEVPALAELEGFIDQSIGGSLYAEADIEAEEGRSNLDLKARAEDLILPMGSVQDANISAQISQLFESPSGSIDLTASGFRQEAVILDKIVLNADGDLAQAQVALQAEGALEDLAEFKADIAASASVEGKQLHFERLAGNLDEYDIALANAATVSWGDGGFSLTPMELRFEDGTVRLAGDMSESAVDLEATWANLPLDISELLTTQAINGRLDGTLSITGDPAAPQVRLETQSEDLRMAFGEQDIPPLVVQIDATAAGGQAQVQGELEMAEAGSASVNASLALDLSLQPWRFELPPDGALDGELQTDLQLQPIPRLLTLTGHLVQGRLEGAFELAGTVSDPRLVGQAQLTGGRYENTTSGTILTDLQAVIEADGRQLRVASLSATDPTGGTVSGQAQMLLEPEQSFPYEAQLDLVNARVVHRDDVSTKVSGTLSAEGDLEEGTATGDLSIGPGEINIPQQLGGDEGPAEIKTVSFTSKEAIAERSAQAAEGVKDSGDGGGMVLRLDIKADVPNRIFVRGQGLDSEWRGNLQISGTADDPRIAGVLTMYKGSLTVFGRRFEFEESTVTFDRDTPPSPYLNLRATADAGDVTALLLIRGTLDTIEIDISSDPPLPEDEVLARVLFGRDISEISPVQALQLAQYARSLSGDKSGFSALGALQKIPGLDRLDFRQGAGEGETAVGVGKYLTEDIYIEVEQGLGQGSSRVNVELELTPQITVEGTAGAGGESRAGIFWKKDY